MFTENPTNSITSNRPMGYLWKIIYDLYIFFPLITMGLISREISSGTIKLLYSSPIKTSEIILGKYLAMIYFSLCLVILFMFTLFALAWSVSNADYVQLMATSLGVFILLCTYSAIGLFISSLTSYQVVAAIVTLGIFALFSNIGGLWQDIDIVRDITYYMNVPSKSYNLIRGLFNLRDFTYFLIIIISFLLFTIIRIKSATESISGH